MAGFDPARFWKITPRLYVFEMESAADKAEIRLREVWFSGMLSSLKKPPTIEEFSRGTRARSDIAACLMQWDKVDAALAANRNKAA